MFKMILAVPALGWVLEVSVHVSVPMILRLTVAFFRSWNWHSNTRLVIHVSLVVKSIYLFPSIFFPLWYRVPCSQALFLLSQIVEVVGMETGECSSRGGAGGL